MQCGIRKFSSLGYWKITLEIVTWCGRFLVRFWPESNSDPLLPVNIWMDLIFDALILVYARESFKIGYSICISGADGVKEQTWRSKNIIKLYVGLLKISENFPNAWFMQTVVREGERYLNTMWLRLVQSRPFLKDETEVFIWRFICSFLCSPL